MQHHDVSRLEKNVIDICLVQMASLKQKINLNNRQHASQPKRDFQLTQPTNNIEQNKNLGQAPSQKFKLILAENKLKTYKNIYKKSKGIG